MTPTATSGTALLTTRAAPLRTGAEAAGVRPVRIGRADRKGCGKALAGAGPSLIAVPATMREHRPMPKQSLIPGPCVASELGPTPEHGPVPEHHRETEP